MNFLKKDLKEEAQIARRRKNEAERWKRIFNPRTRIFGVDVCGWEKQKFEKQAREEKEQQEYDEYVRRKLEEDRKCQEMEQHMKMKKINLEKGIEAFRKNYQQPRDSREYDLNDPDYMKKAITATNGVSKFEGEDDKFKDRTHNQKVLSRAWLLQQMDEKKQINQMNSDHERNLWEKQLAQNRAMARLMKLEEDCRRKLDEATAQFNRLAAEEKSVQRKLEHTQEEKYNADEIKNWVTGTFLTEDPSAAASALGPGKVIQYMYKGEPPEKALATRRDQVEQTLEKKGTTEQEASNETHWNEFNNAMHVEALSKQNALLSKQRELDSQIVGINSILADEHKKRETSRNDVYHLKPTSKFFDQFNRTTY